MACKLNMEHTANKLAHVAGARFPFPDATRASSPVGRRAVNDWVMNVVTSDAPLHQMRKDLRKAGVAITASTNFVDAMGNLGNAVADSQNVEANEYVVPLTKALASLSTKYGVATAEARKQFAVDLGHYREALHAKERQAMFKNIKGRFVGHNAEVGSAEFERHLEGVKARKALNVKFDAENMTAEQYMAELNAIVAQFPIDVSTTNELGGMELTVADKLIAELEAKPNIKRAYADIKPYIDRVFDRVNHIYLTEGKVDQTSQRYKDLYNFKHYAPVFSADDHDNLNQSNYLDNISPDVLQVVEGGIPTERVPFFPALAIQLNAAAKFKAENSAAWKLGNFAKEHGKEYGMTRGGGKSAYGIGDTGHEVARQAVPEHSVPMFVEGKMFWVTIDTRKNKANAQLFDAVKNRFTNTFASRDNKVDQAVRGVLTHAPARLFTNLSPVFWFNSLVRDPLGVGVSIMMDPRIKNKAAVFARAMSLMLSDFNHLRAQEYFLRNPEERAGMKLHDMQDTSLVGDQRAGLDTAFAKWMHRLARVGGETSFNRSFYTADYMDVDTQGSLEAAMPWDIGGSVHGVADAKSKARAVGATIMHLTGNMVTAFDMQARVSTFRALVEGGHSDVEAAAMVREFMDFSQKPMTPSVLSTVIPFFRTTVVGSYRAWDMMMYDEKGDFAPKLAPMAAMITMGVLWAMAGKGDDDDGMPQGDKISHGQAFSRIVVGHNEDGSVKSIPLPYGPAAIFVGAGVALERATSGIHDREDVFSAFAAHVIKNMTPLSMSDPGETDQLGDSFLGAVTNLNPVMASAAALYANKDSFGSTIYAADSGRQAGTEDWVARKPGTPEMWGDLAQFLYENSGGTVDVHPETIEYMLKQWTPFSAGRQLAAYEKREAHKNLGSVEPEDMKTMGEAMFGSIYTDKSPVFYWYNQYNKSMALYRDIQKREDLGLQLLPQQQEYAAEMAMHEARINQINSGMRKMSDEEKFKALMDRRQHERAAAMVGLQLQKSSGWDVLAKGEGLVPVD